MCFTNPIYIFFFIFGVTEKLRIKCPKIVCGSGVKESVCAGRGGGRRNIGEGESAKVVGG